MNYQEYAVYLKSPEWEATRRRAIEHYDSTCSKCGRRASTPKVCHKSLDCAGAETMEDLIVICNACFRATYRRRSPLGRF
jgi:5-methylcytosine-specific restriction endonuclease McrA